MRIALIDNADSFTYNLALYLEASPGVRLDVCPAANFLVGDAAPYDKLVLSPGPGLPGDHPVLVPLIREWAGKRPILGVCLGLQALSMAYGGTLVNLERVFHGVRASVRVTDPADPLFDGLPPVFEAGRYHSWVCDRETLPHDLRITATDAQGVIMAARHDRYPVFGVQFHPESILTPQGQRIVRNFVDLPG